MLTIGEFSRLTHLSVRTLRRYHDAGLLEPVSVDDATGYRYYSPDQIPSAQVVHRLRELDVPLSEVQRILRSPDPATRAGLVADHLQRLESDLARTRAAVASLRRLLRPEPAPLDVELRAVPSATVAAVDGDVAHDDVLPWPSWTRQSANRPASQAGCTTTRCSRKGAVMRSCTGRRLGRHAPAACTP